MTALPMVSYFWVDPRVEPLKYGEIAAGSSQPSKFGRLAHRLVVVQATQGLGWFTEPRRFFMAVNVVAFDHVKVLKVAVEQSPSGANRLFLASGVAIINFHGLVSNYNRDALTFLVPNQGQTNPLDAALDIGHYIDSTAIVYPTAIEASPQQAVGWAVDSFETVVVGPHQHNVQLITHIAALN